MSVRLEIPEPSEIQIYRYELLSDDGVTKSAYCWSGRIHGYGENDRSFESFDALNELAADISKRTKASMSESHREAGVSSYKLIFEIAEVEGEIKGKPIKKIRLSDDEKTEFLKGFLGGDLRG